MRRVIQITALVVSSIVLTLGATDLVLRLTGHDPNTNQRLRFEPTLGWTLDPKWESVDFIRPDGFRHAAPTDSHGNRRLVILGDSCTVGGQLPFRETFAGLLTAWLDGNGEDNAGGSRDAWDVVSFAASGWGTGQQLIALRERGLYPRPDAVILVVFPFNDLCNNNIEQAFTCSILDFHRPYFVVDRGILRATSLHPTRAWLRRHWRLFALAEVGLRWGFPAPRETLDMKRRERTRLRREVLRERSRRAGLDFDSNLHSLVPEPDQPQVVRAGWKITERLMAEMRGDLDKLGVPLIAVVVPYADTFKVGWEDGHRRKGRPVLATHATATVERIFDDLEVPVISVRQRVAASGMDPQVFFHPRGKKGDRHFSSFGHRSVATWILEEMGETGLTGRSAPPTHPSSYLGVISPARPPSDQYPPAQ
jgi:hypothetical protein